MNFIFPSNYAFKNKLFGIIDYSSLFINFIWCFFVFSLVNLLFHSINIKIIVFILFSLPLFIFTIINNSNENLLHVLLYIIKFICSKKLYFYRKC